MLKYCMQNTYSVGYFKNDWQNTDLSTQFSFCKSSGLYERVVTQLQEDVDGSAHRQMERWVSTSHRGTPEIRALMCQR